MTINSKTHTHVHIDAQNMLLLAAFSTEAAVKSIKIGLPINESKTKSKCCRQSVTCSVSHPRLINCTFDIVSEFVYFGPAVTTKNDVSLEIKHSITLANRWYYCFIM